jgi:putative hydrolase of the HAD superfamily
MGISAHRGKGSCYHLPVAIEAILFDLGKVLIDFDFERGMQRFAANSTFTRAEFEKRLFDQDWIRPYERGEISTADFHQHLRRNAGLGMSLEEFYKAWSAIFLPDPIVPLTLLAQLKARYPLILVSNTNELHADFISREYEIFDHFSVKIFSHEVGSLKPDRKIYDAAIAAAGKPPETLFFTDDRQENIDAALKMGIRTHLFRSVSGLVEALKNHGVHVGDFVPN